MENKCVCCGEIIPEGIQVCLKCEKKLNNRKDNKSALKTALTFGFMTGAFTNGGYVQDGGKEKCSHSQQE